MLDFQWNSMRASQGWAKLSLPMYDQPLWKNNGSWFEPPTLRSVSSVVMEIVGTAVGQSWWLSYADDLLFAAMDVGGGYKSASEVGLELAKTAATAASNALGGLAGDALKEAGKFANFAAQAGISMTTNYVTSVANSAVQSLYIGEDGKLGFKTENFTKSLYSTDTISGALGAGITGGMGALNLRDGNNIKLNSNTFNVSGISAFNSLAGGLVQNGVALAMGGNANFNLLSFKGVGMLEFSFGKDGIKSKIGMGGTNISIQNLRNVAAGYKESSKVTDWKYGSTETSSTLNSINMLGYTTSGMNQQLAKDIWNEKLAVEYGDTGNDYGNYTIGENKIVLSENLLGGGREASAKLATVMSHEGSHYNGNRVEAIAHLAGAETYSQLNEMFKLQADKSFSMEMISGIIDAENWKENSGDVDHWKIFLTRDQFGFLQILKKEDGRDDYYVDTKDGEFKIWETDGKSYEDMKSEVWLQNGLELSLFQRDGQGFEQVINAITNGVIDDKLKRNLGLYDIVASNGLLNGDNLNEDDFNDFADSMPYFEGLGYYIDISGLGEKLYESYDGQTVIKIKEPSSIKTFNGSNFLNVFAFGIAETLGYSTNIEGSVQIEPNDYLESVERLKNSPEMRQDPEGNYYKSLQNQKSEKIIELKKSKKIEEKTNNKIQARGTLMEVGTSLLEFGVGSSRAKALGDYSVSTWQNQFDFGNNYFTIQTYCVDYYDPISNTLNYKFRYLSQYDKDFSRILNKYSKEVEYAY